MHNGIKSTLLWKSYKAEGISLALDVCEWDSEWSFDETEKLSIIVWHLHYEKQKNPMKSRLRNHSDGDLYKYDSVF